MHPTPSTEPAERSAVGIRVGVVVSRYHGDVTDALLSGARDAFVRLGGRDEDLVVAHAPGAFELPVLAQVLADSLDIDAVVALGCVITGETRHDEYINIAVANALQQIALATTKPVGFGLLTVANLEQARARAGLSASSGDVAARGDEPSSHPSSRFNKGAETMSAVLATVRAIERLCSDDPLPEELQP